MTIFVTTQFEGLHRWKDAPEATKFLRHFHRHLFHVRLTINVKHDDRELEFFDVKARLQRAVAVTISKGNTGSCEQIAIKLLNYLRGYFGGRKLTCEVSEDGENGAAVFMNEQGEIS